MLTLRNCASKENSGWWDVEAEIQRELEALDADEVTHASGDSQVEVLEEENIISANHHFENLMDRLQLQNEKLLHFEQSVFFPERCTNELHEDTGGSISPTIDLESPKKCGFNNCLLALPNFIRPLCSLDQEDSYYEYICAETLNKKSKGWTTSLEGYQRKADKGGKELKNGQLHIQSSLCTSKSMKQIENAQATKEVKNLKDRILHALRLSCSAFSFHEVKVTNSDIKLQMSVPVSALSWIPNLKLKTSWDTGMASEFSSRAGSHCMTVKPVLTQNTCSSRRKQRPLIYAFLELFKSKVIPVSGTNWDMTRTSVLKQPDINILVSSASTTNFFDASSNSMTYDVDESGLRVLQSLFPELKKLVTNLTDHLVLQSQYLWVELISQLFSLDHKRLLLAEVASGNNGVQRIPYMKHTELHEADRFPVYGCERSKEYLPCALEEADKNDGKLLQKEGDCGPEQGVHLDKFVKLQATIKGYLARKHYQVKLDLQQTKLCYCVTKVQAYWRGRTVRKSSLVALLRGKKLDSLAGRYLQTHSPVDCIDYVDCVASKTTMYLKVVTLQALVRGVLARKNIRTLLSQKEKKSCNLITRVQAVWRGWRIRKWKILENLRAKGRLQEAAIVKIQAVWRGWRIRNLLEKVCAERRHQEAVILKIQAVWRGFRTRRRFWMAIGTSRYDEDDDYEYTVVDDIDISMERVLFDDYASVCHDSGKQFSWNSSLHVSQQLLQLPFIVGGNGARDHQQENSLESKVTKGEQLPPKNDSERDASCDMNSSTFAESDILTNCSNKSSEDNPTVACDDFLQKNEGALGVKQQTVGETRIAVAEIAKDWGFKEERTALQFLKALENTRRRAECPQTRKPDSQTRLRAFMARCGGLKRPSKQENGR